MKRLTLLLVVTFLLLSSCSSGTINGNKTVSSGKPCESVGVITESESVEYSCWQSEGGGLWWRQNLVVEIEKIRIALEKEQELKRRAEERELKVRVYKNCYKKYLMEEYPNKSKDVYNSLVEELILMLDKGDIDWPFYNRDNNFSNIPC
jgi:hypothetical protein